MHYLLLDHMILIKFFFMNAKNFQHINENMYDDVKVFGPEYLGTKNVKSYFSEMKALKKVTLVQIL